MRKMAYRGWCIFARNSRTEWPLHFTFRRIRKDTIEAWKDEIPRCHVPNSDALFQKRIADGSIRVGRAIIEAAP